MKNANQAMKVAKNENNIFMQISHVQYAMQSFDKYNFFIKFDKFFICIIQERNDLISLKVVFVGPRINSIYIYKKFEIIFWLTLFITFNVQKC